MPKKKSQSNVENQNQEKKRQTTGRIDEQDVRDMPVEGEREERARREEEGRRQRQDFEEGRQNISRDDEDLEPEQ